MNIKCHALLQRCDVIVSETNTWSGNSSNEWKNVLDAASRVERIKQLSLVHNSSVFYCISLQHRILIADWNHLVLELHTRDSTERSRNELVSNVACTRHARWRVPPTSLNLSLSRHRHRGVRILSHRRGWNQRYWKHRRHFEHYKGGGRPICYMFDIICGTSTGGILAVALGLLRRPLDEVEQMCRNFSSRVWEFKCVRSSYLSC